MTSKILMSRNSIRRKFNLFADCIERGTLTYLYESLFHCHASLICLRILQHIVTASKCLTGEEEIKADYIVQHLLSCLSVATKEYYSTFLNCSEWWEPQSPSMLESNSLRERCHLARELSVSWLDETCSREMAVLIFQRQKTANLMRSEYSSN